MKPSLVDRINTAIRANDTKTGLIPMGQGPQVTPARTYISPSDAYENELGFDDQMNHLKPGVMRPMWQVYEQQQAHIPVTNLTSSANLQNNEFAHIQGGIPQNPVAPAGTWAPIPQMSATVKTTGPVIVLGSVAMDSSVANDTVSLAIYRDGKLIGNFEQHTIPSNLPTLKNMTAMDNPPPGNHVYAMYWKAGSGTLTAVNNLRNFYVANLSPQ